MQIDVNNWRPPYTTPNPSYWKTNNRNSSCRPEDMARHEIQVAGPWWISSCHRRIRRTVDADAISRFTVTKLKMLCALGSNVTIKHSSRTAVWDHPSTAETNLRITAHQWISKQTLRDTLSKPYQLLSPCREYCEASISRLVNCNCWVMSIWSALFPLTGGWRLH